MSRKRRNALEELAIRLPEINKIEDKEKQKRIERASKDFAYFCEYYLHEYFSCKSAAYQKPLMNIIQSMSVDLETYTELVQYIPEEFRDYFIDLDRVTGIAVAIPRGHGKTTTWTFAVPLYMSLFKIKHFIVLIGADADGASKFLYSISEELQSNERIIEDFGIQKLPDNEWKQNTIVLANDVRISSYGKGAGLRGIKHKQYRPDLVILDDLYKDAEAESSTLRGRINRWFKKTVRPIGDEKTLFVMVNTIAHNDDLISNIFKDIVEEKLPGWIGVRMSAEVKEGQPLWPERYSWEYLKNMEKSIGSIAYAQEYLSRALSDEDRMFKRSQIQMIKQVDIPLKMRRYEGIDPATGAHDMSAVVDIGIAKEMGKIIVLGSHGKKESTLDFEKRLFSRYALYRYKKAGMENVAFQEVFRQQILRDGIKKGLALPIKGMHTGRGSKSQRLSMLSPLIENGTIVFAPGNEDLIDQLCEFPTGKYDDLCDALYYAVKVSGLKGLDYGDEDSDVNHSDNVKLKDLRRHLKI